MAEFEDAGELTVAVVGLGSRGLSIFDFLVRMARELDMRRLRIDIIDPDGGGAGLHATDQPDYLLLNTTCAQVSMFPDRRTLADYPDVTGPSLYEWAVKRDLRLAEDGCSVGDIGRALRPTDFLPRRLLGEYLEWFRRDIESRLPENVRVRIHRAMVTDFVTGDVCRLHLSDGSELCADYAFLTTGHAIPTEAGSPLSRRAPRLIVSPFPMQQWLSAIGSDETVAIAGFGLTAIDALSTLTRGRGGQFSVSDGKLRYEPGGEEPRVVLYSRSGAPFRARPRVCSFDRIHRPVAFTPQRIDALRESRGTFRLDFERDVLPLVYREMRVAYWQCQAELGGQPDVVALTRRLKSGDIDAVLAQLDEEHGRFDPAVALDAGAGMRMANATDYQDWLAGALRRDLDEAAAGIANSPLKAALDVLRQLRDTFRHAVDFGGMTDASLDDFYGRMVPVLNRAVVGPQYERHQELLALLDAGIVRAPLGPAPDVTWDDGEGRWVLSSTRLNEVTSLTADWLCLGAIPHTTVAGPDASELAASMRRRGSLRPFKLGSKSVSGAEIDRNHHPVGADGSACKRVWVLGALCEGAIFYNHLVPSPNTWSRPIADAHRCVADLQRQISRAESASAGPVRRASAAASRRNTHVHPQEASNET